MVTIVTDVVREFLPTPSARRATDVAPLSGLDVGISTHALREEGDLDDNNECTVPWISTHALREEGDTHIHNTQQATMQFLPTPSARRATHRAQDHDT